MKKLVFTITVLLGFCVNSSALNAPKAETKNTSEVSIFETNAINEVTALKAVLKIDEAEYTNLVNLFKAKHKMLYNASDSEETKNIIKVGISQKLKSMVGEADFEKLKANTVLFENLLN